MPCLDRAGGRRPPRRSQWVDRSGRHHHLLLLIAHCCRLLSLSETTSCYACCFQMLVGRTPSANCTRYLPLNIHPRRRMDTPSGESFLPWLPLSCQGRLRLLDCYACLVKAGLGADVRTTRVSADIKSQHCIQDDFPPSDIDRFLQYKIPE